jgi:hypothetical protein
MADPGDIWQRYDAKVMQIQVIEARVAALEKEIVQVRDERDHWARICRDLGKKLSVARSLAERLRSAERAKGGRPETLRARRPAELQAGSSAIDTTRHELDRAREVLGLVLTALTKALDDDEVAELGAKLRHHAGGKLLQSITRGGLTLVPVDGRYLVDRGWLQQLDLSGLRRELDVAAQSGIYTMPEDSLPRGEVPAVDLEVEIDEELDDLDDSLGDALPPPPPLSLASHGNHPPLLSALPDESESFPRLPTTADASMSRPVAPPLVVPPPPDTVRTQNPLTGPFIPNLRVGRLIKNPGTT